MISIKNVRQILGESGESMADSELEKLRNLLYQLIGQLIDNNLEKIVCKKQ